MSLNENSQAINNSDFNIDSDDQSFVSLSDHSDFHKDLDQSHQSNCSPLPVDYGMSIPTHYKQFALVWQNVHFKSKNRHILQGITGDLLPGQLKAIIGPSGVGKSSLLKIITGRLCHGVSGRVYLRNGHLPVSKQRNPFIVSYLPQHDHHYENLTVRETLYIASRIKNNHRSLSRQHLMSNSLQSIDTCSYERAEHVNEFAPSPDHHCVLIERIMGQLLLTRCADTPVHRCSGGEQKRLSIAVELISQPQILILDEPTTGLDFVAALQTIRVLSDLLKCDQNRNFPQTQCPAIMCTIHQPSSSILALFTHLYIIGTGGHTLYHGTCSSLVSFLQRFGLNCPKTYNPADFALQVAYGQHGQKPMEEMMNFLRSTQRTLLATTLISFQVNQNQSDITPPNVEPFILAYQSKRDLLMAIQFERQRSNPLGDNNGFSNACWLAWRCALNYYRDPLFITFNLLNYILGALLIGGGYKEHVGQSDGCWKQRPLHHMDLVDMCRHLAGLTSNSSMIMFSGIILTYMSVTFAVVQQQMQIPMLVREQLNGWYSLGTFCVATLCVQLMHQTVMQLAYISIVYPLTGQPSSYDAYAVWFASSMLMAMFNINLGLIMGSLFQDFLAVLLALCATCPFITTNTFFVHEQTASWVEDSVKYISYQRYYLHSTLQSIYGGSRCFSTSVSASANTTRLDPLLDQINRHYDGSFLLRVSDVKSDQTWAAWTFNSCAALVVTVLYYLTLRWRLRKSAAD